MLEPDRAAADSEAPRASAIAERLREQILSGKYGPGERLPSERELAERSGVHRSCAREALKRLAQEGFVAIRRGGGARVLPLEQAGLGVLQHLLMHAERPDPSLVSQWLDVHELVIAGGARFAVERADDAERARARSLLARLVEPQLPSAALWSVVDELTDLLAVASRNVVLRMVRNALTAQLRVGRKHVDNCPPHKALVQLASAIGRAVQQRDGDAAETHVRTLLRAQRKALLSRLQNA